MSDLAKYDTFSLAWRENIIQQGWVKIKVQQENHTLHVENNVLRNT